MKKLLLLLLLFIVACGSSESDISESEIQAQIDETLGDTTTTIEDNKYNSEENNLNKSNCYEWLGSSNYFGCIQGFEVSLLKTIKDVGRFDSSKINNFIVNENELFIILQSGLVIKSDDSIFLDISERVKTNASESGLYDIAFFPDNSAFLVSYSNTANFLTIEKFEYKPNTTHYVGEIILQIPNGTNNHYCGSLEWSTYFETFLYCVGDMGSPESSLDTSSQKGKILAIDFESLKPDNISESEYKSPLNNIIAYGLRNPWNFIQKNNLLIIPDVGEKSMEELNLANLNNISRNAFKPLLFGWPVYEGNILNEIEYFGLKNWSSEPWNVKEYVVENSLLPKVYYNRPSPDNFRVAIIGTLLVNNEKSYLHNHIVFTDYLSKEVFIYNYEENKLFSIEVPELEGYTTALSTDPNNPNKILISNVVDGRSDIYEILFNENILDEITK